MLLTVLVFIAVLSILIFVHELGHFVAAKKGGIKVEEFGFGLPPRLWGKKIGETIYSLNAIPVGGFVRLYGENEEVQDKKEESQRQFFAKSKKVRAVVTIAGVVMNFLLAFLVFSILYTKLGIPTQVDKVKIVEVVPNSPAQEAGLRAEDLVVFVGDSPVKSTKEFAEITQKYLGKEIILEIARERGNPCQTLGAEVGEVRTSSEKEISCHGENMVVSIVPREKPPESEGPLGVVISNTELKFYPFWEMPFRGAIEGVKESLVWSGLILGVLGEMFRQLVTTGEIPRYIAGPVGIFQVTGQVAKLGSLAVLQFLGILSINLAIVNILPLPALDGGRLLFIGIEAISGRRVKPKIEAIVHQVGLVLLIILLVLITYNDLLRFDLRGKLEDIGSLLTK